MVTQALEDRGVPVLAVAAPDRSADLAVLTGPVTGEMLERATQTLDSLPAVDEVAAVMDCLGPG
jgi:Ni,Fe-hydrogenase III small subunit